MLTNMLILGQVPTWIQSQSCRHMGTTAKWGNRTSADKAILHKIIDKLGKMEQALHDVLRALYVPYCCRSRLNSPLDSRKSLGTTAILAKH